MQYQMKKIGGNQRNTWDEIDWNAVKLLHTTTVPENQLKYKDNKGFIKEYQIFGKDKDLIIRVTVVNNETGEEYVGDASVTAMVYSKDISESIDAFVNRSISDNASVSELRTIMKTVREVTENIMKFIDKWYSKKVGLRITKIGQADVSYHIDALMNPENYTCTILEIYDENEKNALQEIGVEKEKVFSYRLDDNDDNKRIMNSNTKNNTKTLVELGSFPNIDGNTNAEISKSKPMTLMLIGAKEDISAEVVTLLGGKRRAKKTGASSYKATGRKHVDKKGVSRVVYVGRGGAEYVKKKSAKTGKFFYSKI